jgi:hypothetical protein
MMNKQTIIIANREDEEFISISGSICSYVDSDYFKEVVKENPFNKNFITYGVSYHCVRADWIINDDEGIIFMTELLR